MEWVTANPSALGLRPGLGPQDVHVERLSASKHGKFRLTRLVQQYRGMPILGPESVIVLSGHGEMVSLVHGSVVDGREAYANLDAQVPAETAARALRHDAVDGDDDSADAVVLHDLRLHALPSARRIVWASEASLGGAYLGRFAVDAAPVGPAERPRARYVDRRVQAGLEDEVPIQVLGHDLASSPYGPLDALATMTHGTISTGPLLTGSTVPAGTQLASSRVVVRDLGGQTLQAGLAASTRLVATNSEFLAASGPAFAAQRIYHLYQSFYDITDRYLSAPGNPALKQWDSHLGDLSSFAPGTYQPRVAVFLSSGEPCRKQPACAGSYPIVGSVPAEMFEFAHTFEGKGLAEAIGYTHFKNNNAAPDVVAHEFGHVVDSFLFPGVASGEPCMVGVDCVASCVEDTPDEAPALNEAVANLLALLYWYEASSFIDAQDCDAIDWVTRNESYAETPGPCMAELGQIAFMVRDADCPVADAGFCDKPEGIGTTEVCCELDVDPDCVVASPECADKGGGAQLLPTGACSAAPGYRSNSTLEAFWQLLVGRRCAPDAPFDCVPLGLPDGVVPSEAAARALFYALRVGSRSFRQLFDAIASHYACEHGAAAYEGVRAVLCAHRIMDCAAPIPIQCGECGDGILDADEPCDRTSVPVTCEELGYDGGVVTCTVDCELDDGQCVHAVPTGTGPTVPGSAGESGASGATDTGPDGATATAGAHDAGGCDCRHSVGVAGWWMPGLLALVLGSMRRRRPCG